MSPTKRVGLAGAVALMLTGGSYADTTPDGVTNDELRARVAELETTVAELKGDNWLTEQRRDEIRGLAQDVLADADTRASLLTQGMAAGYDDGFVLSNRDGSFSMKINGQMQFRWIYNQQDNSPTDDNRWGFENSRTKLIFTGNVVSQDWTYKLEGNFNRNQLADDDGTFELEDAWVNYDLGNGLQLTFGQFKDPFLREEMVDSRYQLAVERSLVNELFTNDRVQGVKLGYYGDMFRGWAAYSDGAIGGTNSTALTQDTEFAITIRVEGLLMGNWGQFDTMTSPKGDETGVLVGGAVSYEKAESGSPGLKPEITAVTGDVTAEFGGYNIFAALIYSSTDSGVVSPDQYGLVLQGGYYITDNWEGFVRYEYVDLDTTGVEDVNIFTVGVNYYFGADPNAKWTTDVGIGLDAVDGVAASDLAGWRADTGTEDGQIVLRSQLQWLF